MSKEAESILLSDEKIHKLHDWLYKDDIECLACVKVTAKAAAIHAVQFMEGKCTEHPIPVDSKKGKLICKIVYDYQSLDTKYVYPPFYPEHRFNCPECREKIHKELGIV
jgi:hypothetical protein